MQQFLGEYEVLLDAKMRFLLPAAFRKQLTESTADRFVINRGFDGCLVLYPMDVWQATSAHVNAMNDFLPEVRQFKRLFLNGATIVEVDSAGRILLPKTLTEAVGIEKEIVFSAQGNKVELWDKKTYHNYLNQNAGSFSALAAKLANGTPGGTLLS